MSDDEDRAKIRFCPKCGEVLAQKHTETRGRAACKQHGEIFVDLNP